MIKISLITICYNAESTLLPTLESVARQTYPHIEYIVVDGASRDNSLDLVRSICPEALITSEPDRGLYDAMNKGICRATGDYIWFLNAGDSLRRETTVQEVVEAIEQGSAPDIVYGDTMIVDEERKELGLRRLRPPHNLRKKDFLRGMLVCHQAFVVTRRIALPYDLSYTLSSDYDWCLRMLERSHENRQVQTILVDYLAGGLSNQKHWRSLRERFAIMRRHFGLLPTLLAHISFLFIRKR
ncbi:glycosyltransferase family 2 protein [Porphyromonas endodontalis]